MVKRRGEDRIKIPNAEITCRYGAESPEVVEGCQRNKGQVD